MKTANKKNQKNNSARKTNTKVSTTVNIPVTRRSKLASAKKSPIKNSKKKLAKQINSSKKKVLSIKKQKKEDSVIDLIADNIKSNNINTCCNLCKKPMEIKPDELSWKTLCPSCFLKVRGKVLKCDACKVEFLSMNERLDGNYCYDCTLGMSEGVKYSCQTCKKSFYKYPNSKLLKSHCYDCYLKQTGIEKKCASCDSKIFVKKEDSSWKKKCYTCYIHNN